MVTLATLLGIALIAAALRDIFQQLFRPGGRGSVSRWLMRAVWKALRRVAIRRPSLLAFSGPGAVLAVIANWTVLLVIGWTFILWPRMPEAFLLAAGLEPSEQEGSMAALYLSLVTLTTLGYGDITPMSSALRVLVPLEGLVGFALLTAALSWVLSLYPVLARRRSFARELVLIRESERGTGQDVLEAVGPEAAERLLAGLTSRLVVLRDDLIRFPITYYFREEDERSALPAVMPYLADLAQRAAAERPPQVVWRAAMLDRAIDDFAATVSSRFPGIPTAAHGDFVGAYARDHLHAAPKVRDPSPRGRPRSRARSRWVRLRRFGSLRILNGTLAGF